MQLGMIGLGRMGGNIVRRLMHAGHSCVVYDKSTDAVRGLADEGATPSRDLADFVRQLEKPRAVWVMLPAGAITHATIVELADLLEPGDTLIDGGNSFFQDDVRHAELLNAKGICYLDVGTSGGVWGLERGYCMMIGGDREAADHLDPIFGALAPGRGTIEATPGRAGRDRRVEQGYMYCGPAGSGRGAVGGALHPLPLTSGPYLCREDPVGDAQAIRRPPGAAERLGDGQPSRVEYRPRRAWLAGAALRDGHFRIERRSDEAPS